MPHRSEAAPRRRAPAPGPAPARAAPPGETPLGSRASARPSVDAPSGVDAPREKAFLLARPEQRLLEAIARRLPAPVRPDHLTALALAAAVAFAVAAATGHLWTAAALLVVHWFGDSLDGTLARVRRAERPRYGYYLDHLADAAATALVGLGLGLSAHMHLAAGLVLVIAYLALSINSYLETQALGRFTLGYGRLGPTEARIGLIALLAAVALGAAGVVARPHAARPCGARPRRRGWSLALGARAAPATSACSRDREPYAAP